MNRYLFVYFFVFCCIKSSAADVIVDGISYDVNLSTAEASVVAGNYDYKDIIIPEAFVYNGKSYRVTDIGHNAFYNCHATSIVIPHSVISIGDNAFMGTDNLRKLIIPNSVRTIDQFNIFYAKDSVVFEDGNTPLLFTFHKNHKHSYFGGKYLYIGRDFQTTQYDFWGLAGCDTEILEYGDLVTKPLPVSYYAGSFVNWEMEKLETIILGKNIDGMFNAITTAPKYNNVPALVTIISRNDNPRSFSGSAAFFSDTQYMNINLYVPKGAKEKYEKLDGWKYFSKIIEAEVYPVQIMANSYTRQYGEDNPYFDYISSGSPLDGHPVITCNATENSPVGNYPIVLEKGTVKNVCANYVNGILKIQKAPLTIKVGEYTKKQGETNPAFIPTYEGFKNGETENNLTRKPDIICNASPKSKPGEYPILIQDAEANNYEISYISGKLIITEADPVTITAKSFNIKYGDEIPQFGFSSEGATLEGVPDIKCEATSYSPIGNYPIVITKGSVTNYNDTYVNGTLTIEKAPLKIAAKSYIIKQGEPIPTFEITYEGFKNNETAGVLKKKPIVTSTATSASAPGEYEITISGAEAQNYEISYVAGKLTIINADPATFVAKSYTIKYGDALPSFEFTCEGTILDGVPTITCEATTTSPVGDYPIIISKGTITNTNDRYVNGMLTIEKAPLTVTARSYTIKQGESLPSFEAEYTGFKNNETAAVFTKQPSFSTTATSASASGKYDIVVSGAEAQNYEFSYINGMLFIEEALGISGISVYEPANIYDLRGQKVKSQVGSIECLKKGLYIINGKKILVK